MELRLGILCGRPVHVASTAPAVPPTPDARTAGIHASNHRSACTWPRVRLYGWICARTALHSSRRSRLLAARTAPRHQPMTAEPKKPCQTEGCGSGEHWQQPATCRRQTAKAPEHDTSKSISKGCQHACRHRRRVPPRLLTSSAMVPRAATHRPTRS